MTRFWPFRHLGLKFLSVGLAILLWLVVAGDPIAERGLRVPIEMRQFPAELDLGGDVPTAIDVRVRGSSGALSRMSAADIVLTLDLTGTSAGSRVFHLSAANVRVPLGVDVVQVIPDTVVMTFVDRASGHRPVAPAASSTP